MQEQNQNTQKDSISATVDAAVKSSNPSTGTPTPKKIETAKPKPAPKSTTAPGVIPQNDFEKKIIDRIRSSENILVTLSRDPSVDELAAAIALTMFLDGLQKHTTAVYSGLVPDSLKFLQPDETFEKNTDSLQDFIITLSKDKADHLRYKLDGDYVKVYITPYKTVLSENDLEFSHGDFNVDLVLALGVPQATDLDGALSEYGKIMHGAVIVDITCDAPGRFGEIEWSDPGASSVSEMVTKLIFAMQDKDAAVDKEIATALLAGIVAATGRFSNNRTNSETMQLASKLMTMGADQQLISAHIVDNTAEVSEPATTPVEPVKANPDSANLLVGKDYAGYTKELHDTVVPADVPAAGGVAHAEAVAQATAAQAQMVSQPQPVAQPQPVQPAVAPQPQPVVESVTPQPMIQPDVHRPMAVDSTNKVPGGVPLPSTNNAKDYGAMLEAALAEPLQVETAASAAGLIDNPVAANPQMAQPAQVAMPPMPEAQAVPAGAEPVANDGQVVLPPPPDPTAGANMMPPVLPQVQVPEEMAAQQAAEQAQAMAAQAAQAQQAQLQAEPGAFQIPGVTP